jgi:hypothetical protein
MVITQIRIGSAPPNQNAAFILQNRVLFIYLIFTGSQFIFVFITKFRDRSILPNESTLFSELFSITPTTTDEWRLQN